MSLWSDAPLSIRVVLAAATVAAALGLFGVVDAVLQSPGPNLSQLIRPGLLLTLGLTSWLITLPGFSRTSNDSKPGVFASAFAVIVGGFAALVAIAGFAASLLDAGLIAFADVSLLVLCALYFGLGAWCAVVGTRRILRI